MKVITNKIIKAAQYGDIDALTIILDEFDKFAYYYAIQKLNNKDIAQDCVQKSLNYLAKNIHTYDLKTNQFYGWGRSIIDNVLRNSMRDEYRYKSKIENNDEYVLNTSDNKMSSGEFSCMLSQLERIIGEEKYKILIMKVLQNYQLNEISKLLNIPLRTLNRKYAAALKEAREYFGEK